nr:hypothetical protein [Rhodococcus sp. (in: high G+C Gram-positive bacteria)]
MRINTIRAIIAATTIGFIGIGGAAVASAETITSPGTEQGAYCTVVADDGTMTQLTTPAQCLQARISLRIDERKAEEAAARADRAEQRRADRNQ